MEHKHFSSRGQIRPLPILPLIKQVHKRINGGLYAPVAVQIIEIHAHTMFVTPAKNKFKNVNGRLSTSSVKDIHADTIFVTQHKKVGMSTFHCSMDGCGHSYSKKGNLQEHMKTVNGMYDSTAAGRFICLLVPAGSHFSTQQN